jgi:hypothetical protein
MKVADVAGVIDVFVRSPGLIFESTPLGFIGTCFRSLKLTPEEIVQAIDLDYSPSALLPRVRPFGAGLFLRF